MYYRMAQLLYKFIQNVIRYLLLTASVATRFVPRNEHKILNYQYLKSEISLLFPNDDHARGLEFIQTISPISGYLC